MGRDSADDNPSATNPPITPAAEVGEPRTGAGISVVILTYNEEPNLDDCLRSCAWCDDLHVVDSGSADRTAMIARERGAKVYVNPFRSFGQQRNWAIENVPHRYDWVFHLDADERFTPELVDELRKVVARQPSEAGFYVPHKLIFMGRWLRRAEGGSPVYQMRFFHRQRMRFQDWGHGQREDTTGRIGTLTKPYIHYNFSKGLEEWIEKHNRYSTLEAREMFRRTREPGQGYTLFGEPVERRRFFKERLLPRLPGAWFLRFLWTYVLRGGFLDGRPGLYYCLLIASYELFVRLKTEELTSRAAAASAGPPADPDAEAERWAKVMLPRHGPVV
jgi:glycosyltransferase involved in cell wall biosynthesis